MANESVIIGCKLPHGLYLDLHDKNNNLTARVKLPGNAGFTLPNKDRKFKNPDTVYGDTLTPVSKEHWDAWLKIHHDHPSVLNGSIYAAAKQEDAKAKARNHEDENVGFDKLDPDKPEHGVKKLNNANMPVFA